MINDTSAQDRVIKKSSSKLYRTVFGVLLFLSVAVTAILSYVDFHSDKRIQRERIRTAFVTRGDFIKDVLIQGKVIAANAPTLFAPSEGKITLHYQPGETIGRGQIIAEIHNPALKNKLLQEQNQLQRLQLDLEKKMISAKQTSIQNEQKIALEKVALAAAEREKRRAEQSIAINVISQLEYEKVIDDLSRAKLAHQFLIQNASLELENLAFEQKTLRSEITQFELQLAETLRQVNELSVVAPISGMIGKWLVEQKAAVTPSQALLTLIDLSRYEIEIEIPEAYADQLAIGMKAKVEFNQQTFDATITAISPEVSDQVVKGRMAFVDKIPNGLKQNQRINSQVLLEKKENVLMVPRGSFIQHHGGRQVFVVNDNVAHLKPVTLGSYGVSEIEVLAGLSEGQELIISNTDFVEKASILKIN